MIFDEGFGNCTVVLKETDYDGNPYEQKSKAIEDTILFVNNNVELFKEAIELVKNNRCDNCIHKEKCKHNLPVLDKKCREGIERFLEDSKEDA